MDCPILSLKNYSPNPTISLQDQLLREPPCIFGIKKIVPSPTQMNYTVRKKYRARLKALVAIYLDQYPQASLKNKMGNFDEADII